MAIFELCWKEEEFVSTRPVGFDTPLESYSRGRASASSLKGGLRFVNVKLHTFTLYNK